jgi:hypothetical protein
MLRLNPTRLRRFFRCEGDWFAYAVQCVEPRASRSGPGRDRGKTMHALLEHALREYVRTGEVFDFSGDAGYAAAEQVYEDLYQREGVALDEDTAHELLAAIRYHVPLLNLPAWEVLTINGEPAIELRLTAPLIDGVELECIIDVVFRHRATDQVWLVDWKTTYPAIDTADLVPWLRHDYQLVIERMVLAHHGVTVDTSAKVHLRSVAPQPPTITTRGKVSRDKSKLACDWPTYRDAIIANGEDPSAPDVLAVHDHLLTSTFARWRMDVTTPPAEENMRTQVYAAAHRMRALARPDLVQGVGAFPLLNLRDAETKHFRGCESCDYAKWCAASLRTPTGQPDLSLLATDYKARADSPLAALPRPAAATPFDPSADYVRYATERGQALQPQEEFRP